MKRGLLLALAAVACTKPSIQPTSPSASSGWADSVLATLSPRDRAAQLVWPQLFGDYAPVTSAGWERVSDLISQQHVGGFIMSIGAPLETAEKLNAMQRLSALPLVVGADYETGAGFRQRGGYFLPNNIYLGGATVFPPQMGMGATRDSTLAYEEGRITALEGRAMGVQIAFAPVLDVNNNPANPVIGVRSFGENPHLVATMGASFIRGLQEHGMLATGKHFPGHGDTEENSHLQIATVHASRERIDTVELVPFRRAIAAGLSGMMTFHGVIPSLDTTPVPATLNPAIMTGLLRHELGFRGFVVTDAMDMNGVLSRVTTAQTSQLTSGNYGSVNSIGLPEAIKLAVLAGADILLMPSDVPGAIQAVVDGVSEGRFTQARVDSSVRRVLMIKQALHLNAQRMVNLENVRAVVGDSEHMALADVTAERSITLAKDSLNLVPVAGQQVDGNGSDQRVLSITIAGRADLAAGSAFNAELRHGVRTLRTESFFPDDSGSESRVTRLLSLADSADLVILSSYLTTSSTTSSASAPEPVAQFANGILQRAKRTIVVAFGNPYFLQQVPSAPTYLVAWGGFPLSQRAAARALIGTSPITGQLPISIPPLLPYGVGMQRPGRGTNPNQ